MGLGSLLIPGSNDGLILIGIPLLYPYAWITFATMCLTIAAALNWHNEHGSLARDARNALTGYAETPIYRKRGKTSHAGRRTLSPRLTVKGEENEWKGPCDAYAGRVAHHRWNHLGAPRRRKPCCCCLPRFSPLTRTKF